ncbi:MAG: MYXO-CTERM sorting domain-containing protein [Oligoflexia bacterium]|nr:MYXO-CTERM sorting domain-containing protein [Oligoflexia bacterium]
MLLLIALGLPALAFSPSTETYIGVEPNRVYRSHLEVQHRLRHADAWQFFEQGEGAGWQAVFDERTGLARSAWGPPIPLGQFQSGAQVDAAVYDFLARNFDLVGVPVDQLALRAIAYDAETDAWTVQIGQIVDAPVSAGGPQPVLGGEIDLSVDPSLDPLMTGGALADESQFDFRPTLTARGAAVWRGGIRLRIVHGHLVWLSVKTYPDADQIDTSPTLSAATAVERAVQAGPEPLAVHQPMGARLVVLPTERWGLGVDAPAGSTGTGLEYALAWEVHTRTADPAGVWVSFVDAHSGDLLWVYNQVRYVSGTLTGTHDVRTVDGNLEDSALMDLLLTGDLGDSAYTDADGAYDLGDSKSVSASLSGSRVRAVNQAGSNAAVDFEGDFNWTDADADQAEIDTFVYLHQVLEWHDIYAPDVPTGGRLTSNVNLNSTCNAYFDGSVNFYRAGGGCNNTGRIADVNYHEWGHGFHYYSLESGTYDGSVSEGIGDTTAFLQTEDNIVAPYFMTNGDGIRDVSVNRVYPDDVTGEVHADGLIYAGAMWDLWDLLKTQYSADDAYLREVSVFTNGIKAGPTLDEAYDAAILGDDDNGDLSDGTPNQCAIIDAFSEHGLGPAGGASLVTFSHETLDNQDAALTEYPVVADLVNVAPDCVDFELSAAQVTYSVDDGETWQSADLDLNSDGVSGAIPAQPAGTVVQYYLAGQASDGTEITLPEGAFINPFTFVVGDMVELWCADFEGEGESGFTHTLLDGQDKLGADDWMWGTPRGMADDPDFAWSGDNVWGNDLGGGNYNGEYQNSKHNRLTSPALDVSGTTQVVLQYRRWLNVEDGYWDTAQIVLVGDTLSDDVVLWQNYASAGGDGVAHTDHTQDRQWTLHSLVIDVPDTDQITLGWDIISDGGLTFGGWNIDDVCLYTVADSLTAPAAGDTGGADTGGSAGGDGGSDSGGNKSGGCGCASTPGSASGGLWVGLLTLGLALVRRRREAA